MAEQSRNYKILNFREMKFKMLFKQVFGILVCLVSITLFVLSKFKVIGEIGYVEFVITFSVGVAIILPRSVLSKIVGSKV